MRPTTANATPGESSSRYVFVKATLSTITLVPSPRLISVPAFANDPVAPVAVEQGVFASPASVSYRRVWTETELRCEAPMCQVNLPPASGRQWFGARTRSPDLRWSRWCSSRGFAGLTTRSNQRYDRSLGRTDLGPRSQPRATTAKRTWALHLAQWSGPIDCQAKGERRTACTALFRKNRHADCDDTVNNGDSNILCEVAER